MTRLHRNQIFVKLIIEIVNYIVFSTRWIGWIDHWDADNVKEKCMNLPNIIGVSGTHMFVIRDGKGGGGIFNNLRNDMPRWFNFVYHNHHIFNWRVTRAFSPLLLPSICYLILGTLSARLAFVFLLSRDSVVNLQTVIMWFELSGNDRR
jgi:hypothetical protein